MNQPAVNPYLRTKVMTAKPQELRLMLYDGAIRFCHQARAGIEAGRHDEAYHGLVRAQKIIMELSTSLKHSIDTELCERLAALYTYIYRKLVEASVERDVAAIDEAMQLIEYERRTWQMLMEQTGESQPAAPGDANVPSPPAPTSPYAMPAMAGTYSRSA